MKLDLSRSWIVGDRSSDIAAGRGAHLEGGILISPSQDDPERNTAAGLKAVQFVVETSASLANAVALLLSQGRLTPQHATEGHRPLP